MFAVLKSTQAFPDTAGTRGPRGLRNPNVLAAKTSLFHFFLPRATRHLVAPWRRNAISLADATIHITPPSGRQA